MSYSFSIKANSKEEANKKIEENFTSVIQYCPEHEADRQIAQDAAKALIDILEPPSEDHSLFVNISGWLSWQADHEYTGASMNIQVGHLSSKTASD